MRKYTQKRLIVHKEILPQAKVLALHLWGKSMECVFHDDSIKVVYRRNTSNQMITTL